MITTTGYSIDVIVAEARDLVSRGLLGRHQPIYTLCQYIPQREWETIERELERNDFLLRDPIIDLLGCETWEND
ncbi:DUF4327 family protein [Baaleninema sp.]|uniref:DUF4327 family protein n=1 Tax=Baaleninema sp. TaxID=3101197 RepID=UPI003D0082D4